jgi:AraC-like DNA-binding protein
MPRQSSYTAARRVLSSRLRSNPRSGPGIGQVKVWRSAALHNAELYKGVHDHRTFPWHSRESMCIGVVTDGALSMRTRKRSGMATRGSFVLTNAEEAFQGWTTSPQGVSSRYINIRPDIVRRTAEELTICAPPLAAITFRGPVFEDAELAQNLLELHRSSEVNLSPMKSQSQLLVVISRLLARHAETHVEASKTTKEPIAVQRARVLLNENLSRKMTLDELSEFAGLPPFRLLRAFRQATGLTPHAYQMQARIRVARESFLRQERLAAVAAAVGFADQAHMTRVFKSVTGATPGQYRAAAARDGAVQP